MERIKTVEYVVGEHFLYPILYADSSGLDDNEERDFDEFDKDVRETPPDVGYSFGHWSAEGDTIEFDRCEVTGLMGRCSTIVAVYFHKDA